MSAAIQVVGPAEQLPSSHPVLGPISPIDLLNRAIANGAGIETLRELLTLRREWEADEARKAFDAAISAAKARIPTITKNKRVAFESRRAGSAATDYRHETLDEIARVVTPILAEHGLSYRFRATSEPNQPISVTCIISHRGGHFEETTLLAGRDDSGNKNAIQQIGSTITYLQRYTLKAALGLSASEDDDGAASTAIETVSADDVERLQHLIVSTASSIPDFLKWARIERLEDMRADQFPAALRLLEQKAAQQDRQARECAR